MFEQLPKDIEHYQRNRESMLAQNKCIALIHLDLDNFKPVNDSLGHSAGDILLQQLAQRLTAVLTEQQQVIRFGGDEFAVLLSGHDTDSAELVARRLVKVINQHYLCQQYNVSASAGLSVLRDEQNCRQLFSSADSALYQAKEAGKSTVRVA